MSWLKKVGLKLFKKKTRPDFLFTRPLPLFNDARNFIPLKCGCHYYWIKNTSQTILFPLSDGCQEGHRAEIAENVSKEDWENLLKVNNVLGPQQEIDYGFMVSSGYGPTHPIIINQGGNTP